MSEEKEVFMDLELYSYYRSSCSYRVRIGLELKKLAYKYIPIHLVKDGGEQLSDSYTQMNPLQQVPTLKHGSLIISQSMAILLYLDAQFPQLPLFPKDKDKYAKCLQICEMINSGIQPIQNLDVMKTIQKRYNTEDSEKLAWGKYWIEKGFIAVEEVLKNTSGKFCIGDDITAADALLIPQIYNAHRFKVEMDQFTDIQKIARNLESQDAFIKAHPSNQPDTPKD